jgi:hypothetical protein
MSGFGQEAWFAAGHSLLTEPITGDDYMDVLVERQKVYQQRRDTAEVRWIAPLLEWFCWAEDNDFVILPDRVAAEPKAKPPAPTREALTAKRDALQSQLDRLTTKLDAAGPTRRHGTDDMAAYGGIGIRQTARQRARWAVSLDKAIAEHARLSKRVSDVRASLARVEAQIARLS